MGLGSIFDCSSEVPFEECTFCIEGSSLWRKVVLLLFITGLQRVFSDFAKAAVPQ